MTTQSEAVAVFEGLYATDGEIITNGNRLAAFVAENGTSLAALAALGVTLPWDAATAWPVGAITLDRGGTWQAVSGNTNSRPVSGNANWTLIGGMPYVDVVFTPDVLVSSALNSQPGVTVIPAAVAGLWVLPTQYMTATSDGVAWTQGAITVNLRYKTSQAVAFIPAMNSDVNLNNPLTLANRYAAPTAPDGYVYVADAEGNDISLFLGSAALSGGALSLFVRIYYRILPTTSADFVPYFAVVDVVQVAKTFLVPDPNADLGGATGSIIVIGSTGNDGTYTIVSAVADSGYTTITVVQAIPDATADGWVKQ